MKKRNHQKVEKRKHSIKERNQKIEKYDRKTCTGECP